MEVRQSGDYGKRSSVTPEESSEQVARAEEFLQLGERTIGSIPPQTEAE
jgi:hypothetical protein